MKLTVLIPVYNEINTIHEILNRVQAVHLADEIIVVDDGSTDGTRQALQDLNCQEPVRIILHPKIKAKAQPFTPVFRMRREM